MAGPLRQPLRVETVSNPHEAEYAPYLNKTSLATAAGERYTIPSFRR